MNAITARTETLSNPENGKMDKMKLCVVTPELLPVWGGAGTYVVELIRHLPKNIEVHVVTANRKGFGKEKVSSSDYNFSEYFGDNIQVHFVCEATDTFIYNAGFQLACLKHIPKLVKKEGIDLIHIGHHMAGLLLEFKRLNIPAVTTIHNTFQGQRDGTKMSGMKFQDLEFSEKAIYLTYPFLRLAEIVYFSKPRYYITVSDWMKRQLRSQYPRMKHSPIYVIHNSVDAELFSPDRERQPLKELILFTGRIIAAKGIKYLVEAIPKILKEHPEAFFMFIGAGNSLPYQRLLKDMGVSEKNFAFLGYLKERNELVRYYRACSVYTVPTTLWENLPIRLLEAMACQAPVVASNLCAIPEVIDNYVNGVLVPPGSAHELASAICHLLDDSDLRRKIGENARKTVLEKFDCNVHAARTAEVYRRILDQS